MTEHDKEAKKLLKSLKRAQLKLESHRRHISWREYCIRMRLLEISLLKRRLYKIGWKG